MKPWQNRSLKDLAKIIDGELRIEEWKFIDGFEGKYMISNFGRIKSLKRIKPIIRKGHPVNLHIKERIIGQFLDACRYPGVKIHNEVPYWFHTHRLVGIHFIDNPDNLPEINHKWGDKEDNCKWHLYWCTKADNLKHAFKIGLKKSKFQQFGSGNPKSKPVSQYNKDGTFIQTFAGQQEASRITGINQSQIWHICNGKGYTAGGFIWKYADGFGLGRRGGSIYEIKGKE